MDEEKLPAERFEASRGDGGPSLDLTIRNGRIDAIADPDRLRDLELAVLDD